MLAYLFWHTPSGSDLARYESGLVAFHRALAAHPPDAFACSWSMRIERPSWLPNGAAHYVDWYVVDGFAALGALNEAAVSGARQPSHDAVAALARTGTAGLVRHLVGPVAPGRGPSSEALAPGAGAGSDAAGAPAGTRLVVAMVDKPAGQPYSTFRRAVADAAPGASCWERQMTLGPGAEYIVLHDSVLALPWPATVVQATAL